MKQVFIVAPKAKVEYMQRVKVEAAKSTLEKGRKSIFEVMFEVGYSDEKAFREVFKKIRCVLFNLSQDKTCM